MDRKGQNAMTMRTACALALATLLVSTQPGMAAPVAAGAPLMVPEAAMPVEPARSVLRKLLETLAEDDYVHDDHYDWHGYPGYAARQDRARDYWRMQKDYWRAQKEAQKAMIKRQRGW